MTKKLPLKCPYCNMKDPSFYHLKLCLFKPEPKPKKTTRRIIRVKKNPSAKRRARVGSFRDRYVKAEQMERLGRHIAASRVTKKSVHKGLVLQKKSRARIVAVRKNPSHINRRKPKVSTKFYLIEGLVRESAHSRKFDYRYYTGTGFVGDRHKGFLFSTKSAADTGMRKIVNSLPKEILQIRSIPA